MRSRKLPLGGEAYPWIHPLDMRNGAPSESRLQQIMVAEKKEEEPAAKQTEGERGSGRTKTRWVNTRCAFTVGAVVVGPGSVYDLIAKQRLWLYF